MKAVRKLSTSIHNVGNMITNKISDVKTKGGTQLKLQVICPADGYPGKQITISTPEKCSMVRVYISSADVTL